MKKYDDEYAVRFDHKDNILDWIDGMDYLLKEYNKILDYREGGDGNIFLAIKDLEITGDK